MAKTESNHQKGHIPIWTHVVSWAIMIIMTAVAFLAVGMKLMPASIVIPFILFLCVIQVFAQIYIFMHLNTKSQAFQMLFMGSGLMFATVFAVGLWLMAWTYTP
ncbi:cytochrome C oxidase subunit IV family protein [Numidum massiliense]|uniref:cytochrome C oxidase subunit IV family protein n=1 Tax=Numidum massiliense TaxID=1522315 RepID=UPI0006D54EF3|nr:cytochrome C oxidase subunit IV family protein [Numidum massiliense]